MSKELKAPAYYEGYAQALKDVRSMLEKSDLNIIYSLYETSRGIGHTTAAFKGVMNTPNAKLLVPKFLMFKDVPKDKITTIYERQSRGLPLVMDNSLIFEMAKQIRGNFERLISVNLSEHYYPLKREI